MSKVLQFFGIGKKQEGQGLQMLQNARSEGKTEAFGEGEFGVSRPTLVSTPLIPTHTSQVVSKTIQGSTQRSNIMGQTNEEARQKIDVFRNNQLPMITTQSQKIYTSSENHISTPGIIQNSGGYASGQAGGYSSGQAGGYSSGQAGGYSSSQAGGFSSSQVGGFGSGQAGGYSSGQAGGLSASQSMRGMSALEVYSTPVRPIDYGEIRTKLTNFVERTFPSPFPSRVSDPEDFDNALTNNPYPSTHIEYLMDNSKDSDKTKETQKNKFLNYKKEIEFCKRYINMNEVKKQKLLQEIEDYKRRQSGPVGGAGALAYNDAEFRGLEAQLQDNEMQLAQEKQELEQLKAQLASSGYDYDQAGGSAQGHYHSDANIEQFNSNAFAKKSNVVQAYDHHGDYHAESGREMAYHEHATQGGYDQHGYGGQNVVSQKNVQYKAQGYGPNDSQNWGHQDYQQQQGGYAYDQHAHQNDYSQGQIQYGGQGQAQYGGQAQQYRESHTSTAANQYNDQQYGGQQYNNQAGGSQQFVTIETGSQRFSNTQGAAAQYGAGHYAGGSQGGQQYGGNAQISGQYGGQFSGNHMSNERQVGGQQYSSQQVTTIHQAGGQNDDDDFFGEARAVTQGMQSGQNINTYQNQNYGNYTSGQQIQTQFAQSQQYASPHQLSASQQAISVPGYQAQGSYQVNQVSVGNNGNIGSAKNFDFGTSAQSIQTPQQPQNFGYMQYTSGDFDPLAEPVGAYAATQPQATQQKLKKPAAGLTSQKNNPLMMKL